MKIEYIMKNGLTSNIKVPSNKTVNDVLSYVSDEISYFTKYKTLNGVEQLFDTKYIPRTSTYVQFYGTTLNLVSKYNRSYDLRVRMSKKGMNNLFDYSGFYLHNIKTNEIISNENLSDWFAPYIVRAVNNGNNTATEIFTGGSHGYNGKSTARTEKVEFWVDGKKYESYSGKVNTIIVKWTNYVQAYNTEREVLKETWSVQYDGNQWNCENNIKILEDCIFQKYYGLQSTCNLWKNKVLYHNSSNNYLNNYGVATNSGSKTCNLITVCGDGHNMDIGINLNVGLGKLNWLQGVNYNAFASSGDFGKVYFYLINGNNYALKDNIYTLKGFYRFYSD